MFPKKITQYPNEILGIVILRIAMASMWISQGLLKAIDRNPANPAKDYHSFLEQLQLMASTHPDPQIGSLITSILVQNYEIMVWIVIFTELFIGITILFGLFSRIGSFVGMNMTIMLWVLTLGWGEWFFTFPFIFTPMLVIFISNSSHSIGLDSYLTTKKIFSGRYTKYLI